MFAAPAPRTECSQISVWWRSGWKTGHYVGGPWLWSDSSTLSNLRFSSPALKLISLTATKGCCHSTHHILSQGRKKRGRPCQPCLSPFNKEANTFPEMSTNVASTIMVPIAIPRNKAGWEEAQLAWHSAARNKIGAVLKGRR